MSKTIVYTVATGKKRFAEMALGLGRSLKLVGDTHPRVIVTDIEGYDWKRYFDVVLKPTGQRSALDKLFALDTTDADRVLSIDADMLAYRRLDEIFEYCQGKPFTVQGALQPDGSFHGVPVAELLKKFNVDMFPRFNGGMAYYERSSVYEELLAEMRSAEAGYADLGFQWFREGAPSEEVCMAMAMVRNNYYEFIPPEKDFQHSAAGLVGKLHLDINRGICEFLAHQEHVRLCKPILFHAWRYKDFLVYWRELKKLEEIAAFEDAHPSMYISRFQRKVRSLHRRILKSRGL